MTSSEAYARAETCARLAKRETNGARRKTLKQMRRLWMLLAEEAQDPGVDITNEFEKLLDIHMGLCQSFGITSVQ